MIRNYRDLTRLEMEQVDREHTIVLIPLGALEQHGSQAPLGTDDIIAEAMSKELKKQLEAEDEDFPMLLFPVMPVGLSTEHRNFCGSITFRPDTYYHMLYDISVSLIHHGFKKLAFLICHGGNAPIVQVLSRELRSEFGISPFLLSSGAFSHPDVKATVSEGNIWDFHGGEMETSMVMAVDESLVKLEYSEPGIPKAFEHTKTLQPYGSVSIGWVSEDWKTAEGKPIGIGGDPRGATAEKGRIILETSAKVLVPGLKEIREWED
ncbi:MAG: creatininase family protein [Eubacteriales bacterium]|nr:creatininase family protein [Eubacteriales bacterium]